MSKPFEKDGQKDFRKLGIFSKSSKHFITELAQESSYQFLLALYSELRLLHLFPLNYSFFC